MPRALALVVCDYIEDYLYLRSLPMPIDFSGQNLRGRSFTGLDLTNTNFSYFNVRGANFTNTLLRGANFSYAKAGLNSSAGIGLLIISFNTHNL